MQLTIGTILAWPLANAADQEIIDAGGVRLTYRTLGERVRRMAAMLAGLGVGRGSVVAVMDWDSHRYLEAFFAVPMMGAVLHTVNVRLPPEQILYTITHARDDVILAHPDFLPILEGLRDRLPEGLRVVALADAAPEGAPLCEGRAYGPLMAAADPAFAWPDLPEDAPATLFYTTGTTGEPKGVSFAHRQIVLHTLGTIAALGPVPGMGGLHRRDVYMPITPLFHVHAWGVPYVATLLGLRQVYPGRYEPARLLGLIAEHGVTFSHCVPTILAALLAAPEAEATDLARWKVLIGGSALTPGLAAQARARGIDVHAGYGMSETCPLLTIADMAATWEAPDDLSLRVATGKPVPLVELGLRDEAGAALPHDGAAEGEVVARSPWLTAGYLRNPEATGRLWRDGWLRTGDVGRIAADGTLRIGDRLKDVIKSGGEWVSSLDLESLASEVAGVAEAAAVGLPDARWGERPCLLVVLRGGAAEAEAVAALRAAFAAAAEAGRLPRWAAPDRIDVVPALPRTSVGKLDKKLMRRSLAGG